MTGNANVETLKRAYAEWDRSKGNNPQVWVDLVGDEFELFSIGGGRDGAEFSARCTCPDDVHRYFSALTADWEMQYCRMDDYIADGDRVVALGRHEWKNRRTGKTVETAKCDVFRFRDGRITGVSEFYDSHGVMEAARADEGVTGSMASAAG